MKIAIVGSTGFVGGYLLKAYSSAEQYSSKNIDTIRGKDFDLLLVAAMPAEKWRANKFPDDDRATMLALQQNLSEVKAEKVVLFSTVDVFSNPVGVSEDSKPISISGLAYGSNRLLFEKFISTNFANTWIIRLPGLVGEGLKKNVLFDLKNAKSVASVPINSKFQFYPMSRLSKDLDSVLKAPPGIYHFAAEPVSMHELTAYLKLPFNIFGPEDADAASYDFRTIKGSIWSQSGDYLVSRLESLRAIESYLS